MESAKSHQTFMLKTDSKCFLCSEIIENEAKGEKSSSSSDSESEEVSQGCGRTFSIESILRYLKINLINIKSLSRKHISSLNELDIRVNLCKSCGIIVERFEEHYEGMELHRKMLEFTLEVIQGKLEEMEEKAVNNFEEGENHSEIVEELREKVREKCRSKINIACVEAKEEIHSEDEDDPGDEGVEDGVNIQTIHMGTVNARPRRIFAAETRFYYTKEDGNLVCKICKKEYLRKKMSHLQVHLRRHRQLRPFKCSFCGKPFSTKGEVERHERIHTGYKPYKCELCDNAYTDSSNLAKHRKTHEPDYKKKIFKCSGCPKAFPRKGELVRHERIHTGDKPYKCEVCGKDFSDSSNLLKHRRARHQSPKPKDFKCVRCTKAFATKEELQRHDRTHTGDKPYKCEVCDKAYADSSNFAKHKRKHDPDFKPVKPRGFICTVCKTRFQIKEDLLGHQRSWHPELETRPD